MLYIEMLYSMVNCAGMGGIPMRKLICDKCGEEIDISFMDKYNIKPAAFCRIYGRNDGQSLSDSDDLEYELCQNCANQLVTFLKG